jgi:hypothetical protein
MVVSQTSTAFLNDGKAKLQKPRQWHMPLQDHRRGTQLKLRKKQQQKN